MNQSLPPILEPHHEPVIESGGLSEEEQQKRAMKKQLAKLRLKNETPDKFIST